MGIELAIPSIFDLNLGSAPFHSDREPLTTNFMDVNWQQNNPPNPADAAIGPQGYDNHLYYSFGVSDLPHDLAACLALIALLKGRRGSQPRRILDEHLQLESYPERCGARQ
jgi:hypothetical protein